MRVISGSVPIAPAPEGRGLARWCSSCGPTRPPSWCQALLSLSKRHSSPENRYPMHVPIRLHRTTHCCGTRSISARKIHPERNAVEQKLETPQNPVTACEPPTKKGYPTCPRGHVHDLQRRPQSAEGHFEPATHMLNAQ